MIVTSPDKPDITTNELQQSLVEERALEIVNDMIIEQAVKNALDFLEWEKSCRK